MAVYDPVSIFVCSPSEVADIVAFFSERISREELGIELAVSSFPLSHFFLNNLRIRSNLHFRSKNLRIRRLIPGTGKNKTRNQ